jgi:hypothetical protein
MSSLNVFAACGESRILASFFPRVTLGGMTPTRDLQQLATNYHRALPGRIRRYLNEGGFRIS